MRKYLQTPFSRPRGAPLQSGRPARAQHKVCTALNPAFIALQAVTLLMVPCLLADLFEQGLTPTSVAAVLPGWSRRRVCRRGVPMLSQTNLPRVLANFGQIMATLGQLWRVSAKIGPIWPDSGRFAPELGQTWPALVRVGRALVKAWPISNNKFSRAWPTRVKRGPNLAAAGQRDSDVVEAGLTSAEPDKNSLPFRSSGRIWPALARLLPTLAGVGPNLATVGQPTSRTHCERVNKLGANEDSHLWKPPEHVSKHGSVLRGPLPWAAGGRPTCGGRARKGAHRRVLARAARAGGAARAGVQSAQVRVAGGLAVGVLGRARAGVRSPGSRPKVGRKWPLTEPGVGRPMAPATSDAAEPRSRGPARPPSGLVPRPGAPILSNSKLRDASRGEIPEQSSDQSLPHRPLRRRLQDSSSIPPRSIF